MSFIDIPNLPGVPALSSYAANAVSLLAADAATIFPGLNNVLWGVYLTNGFPVITPSTVLPASLAPILAGLSQILSLTGQPNIAPVIGSTIEFEIKAQAPISNYPQEQGAFQSYNKVTLPPEITLVIACSGNTAERQAFLNTLDALRISTQLVDIVTPEKIFTNYNCTDYGIRRTAESGVTMLTAHVHFELVPIAGDPAFSNTQQPGEAGAQGIGGVQPAEPSATFSERFATAGGPL